MKSVVNPFPLARIIGQAQSSRVPVLIVGDSKVYTYGGWQNAFPMALRRFAPLYGSGVVATAACQAANQNANTPGSDVWPMLQGPGLTASQFATSGAPSAQEAIFKYFSNRYYSYLASGTASSAYYSTLVQPFAGIDVSKALRHHIWGAGFSSGGGAMEILLRLAVSPQTTYMSSTTVSCASGANERLHWIQEVAADAARNGSLSSEFKWNQNGAGTAKLFFTGCAVEVAGIRSGFAPTSFIMEGGKCLTNSLGVYNIFRASGQEVLRQVRELNGTPGRILVFIDCGQNDRNYTTACYEQSCLAVAATSTTITLSGITGNILGYKLTYNSPLDVRTEETKTITAWNASTQVATVSTWTNTPAAGDAVSISPTYKVSRDPEGLYTNARKMIEMLREDLASQYVDLEPTFVISPCHQVDATPDAYSPHYFEAVAQIAAESSDVVACEAQRIMPYDTWSTENAGDHTHPGGHAQAVYLGKMFNAALLGQ